jgi:hypothetical protein
MVLLHELEELDEEVVSVLQIKLREYPLPEGP